MLHKVLVANRGEGLPCFNRTGCPERRRFPHEDRKSEHVLKADEATRSELQDILPATTSTQRRSHGLWSRQKRTQSTRVTQNGQVGDPPGGWPERFSARALQGRNTHGPVSKLSSEDAAVLATDPRNTVNRLLIPWTEQVLCQLPNFQVRPVSAQHQRLLARSGRRTEYEVILEPGKHLLLVVQSVSDADERGLRTHMCTVNGQPRPVQFRDELIAVDVRQAERSDTSQPGQIAPPLAGVVSLPVDVGQQVSAAGPSPRSTPWKWKLQSPARSAARSSALPSAHSSRSRAVSS
jgi:pyruvate carboxylase